MIELRPRFKSVRILRDLCPNYIIDSTSDLSEKSLVKNGVKAIAFDVDSTLVAHDVAIIDPQTINHITSLKLPLYVATNRTTPKADAIADALNASAIIYATKASRKPQRRYFRRLLNIVDRPPETIAFVGDRLFTDVIGANRSHLLSVYVKSLGKDPWYMRYTGLRKIENALVRLLGVRLT